MRERLKEPRKGSEIDSETACIQTVGALASSALRLKQASEVRNQESAVVIARAKRAVTGLMPDARYLIPSFKNRVLEARVTAYLLYNGSATYVL